MLFVILKIVCWYLVIGMVFAFLWRGKIFEFADEQRQEYVDSVMSGKEEAFVNPISYGRTALIFGFVYMTLMWLPLAIGIVRGIVCAIREWKRGER